ncbi:MAG TPA: hypothetical protein VGM33_23105 [Baekduia sp.]
MASDDPIDELYGVDFEQFVSARTALAKRLRADGDREGAAAVGKLVKPTRAAWAVNRLVRDRPQEIGALVEAGEALAGAQEQLLDGAEADVLRGAADAARRLVDALADEAPVQGAARDKVRATLHAATVDEDVRAEVAAGRVLREHSASGFGGLDALLAAGFEAKGGRHRKPAREPEPEPEPPRPDPREVRRRRDALRRAKEAEAKAEDALTGAQRSLDQVESTITARRRELEEAQGALDDARDRRERAERAAAEVQEA